MMEEMEMPTPCQVCTEWFDLTDGYGSKKWHPNTVICKHCFEKEKAEIELEEEIQDWVEMKENAECDIQEANENLVRLGHFKTSEEWSKDCEFTILDPDGWDRKNFDYSWSKELISKSEFDKRVMVSTVTGKLITSREGN